MKKVKIEFKYINDNGATHNVDIEVEDFWTDFFIIDNFWNNDRYRINKSSIRIISKEDKT